MRLFIERSDNYRSFYYFILLSVRILEMRLYYFLMSERNGLSLRRLSSYDFDDKVIFRIF